MTSLPTRLLLVEDEPAHAEAIRRSLEGAFPGATLRVVSSVRAFHAAVAHQVPDIALVDFLLPDGRAVDLLTAPAESGAFPIVLITSHGDELTAVQAMKSGALDYIVKSPEAFANVGRSVERSWREWQLLRERRGMEAEVRSERARLQVAMQAAQAGAFEWDLVTGDVHWSPELFDLYEMHADEAASLDAWRKRVHHDDLAHAEATVAAALETGVYEHDFRIARPNGEYRWLAARARVVYDGAQRPTRIVGINMDVTERRRVEEELRTMTDRYRHLVEASVDWIWETVGGRFTFASGRVHDLLGYTPDEVVGRTPYELMPPDEGRRVAGIIEAFGRQRAPFIAVQNTCVHKDGRLVVFETSGLPVIGPRGEFIGYRGIARDVTLRLQLEQQVRQAQKLEAIGQLAGGVAHDFNNILAAMMMHIELLQANPSIGAEVAQSLRELASESQRAAALTRQLLMFSRRSVMSTRALDLNEVISNLLKMLRRLIGEHIDLRFESRGHLPAVEADAGLIEQVIMNLVVNARDAMAQGGQLTISAATIDLAPGDPRVTAADAASSDSRGAARTPGRYVCLRVEDTGCGMDPLTLRRIFEPFFTTKESGKGTGLGLATVHGIVAQHKGWVEVESIPGAGSVFMVFLPTLNGPAVVEAGVVPAPAVRGGKETVLLVEDEPSLRRMVARVLTGLGYRVIEADTGQQAMTLWQAHGPEIDLLFTDMVMPEGLTGLELAEQLQRRKPSLATIISSGYSADLVGRAPTRAGVVYLPKPYDLTALAGLVRDCLDRSANAR